jgi:hypothetical protein
MSQIEANDGKIEIIFVQKPLVSKVTDPWRGALF